MRTHTDGPEAGALPVRPAAEAIPGGAALPLSGRWLLNVAILGFGEALALVVAFLLGGSARVLLKGSPMIPEWFWLPVVVWWLAAVTVRLLPGWGLGAVEELRRTVLLLVGIFAATTTALFLLKRSEEMSRLTLSLSFLWSLPLVPYARIKLKTLLLKCDLWGMRSIVFGGEESARSILAVLRAEPGLGYKPIAIHDPATQGPAHAIEGIPVTADVDPKRWRADAAILAAPVPSRELARLLEGPLSEYRHVVVIPDLAEAPSLWVTPRSLGSLLGLEISQNLNGFWASGLKRASDLTLVAVLSPAWVLLTILIAAVILVAERATPFFVQRRLGLGGREFRMWKFRTMRPRSEEALERALADDEGLQREWSTNFKIREDPRVTPIGRFLRRTSLDELPQLWNVLRGEMSLVGPRPLPAYHARELPARVRSLRESVRPGVTGLWQVSGRSESGTEGIIRSDFYYLRNWSVWLDIVIVVRTFRAIRSRTGAY